jgi:hypothetical protein
VRWSPPLRQLRACTAGWAGHMSEEYRCRFSFCCDRDGCRKRMTPPSVRFLGRKVYLGAVVTLISAMRQGPRPRRVHELARLFGVGRATVARWQAFWRDGRRSPAEDASSPLSISGEHRLRRRSYAVEAHEKSLEASRLNRPRARGTDPAGTARTEAFAPRSDRRPGKRAASASRSPFLIECQGTERSFNIECQGTERSFNAPPHLQDSVAGCI